jgi:hypothetical protein
MAIAIGCTATSGTAAGDIAERAGKTRARPAKAKARLIAAALVSYRLHLHNLD